MIKNLYFLISLCSIVFAGDVSIANTSDGMKVFEADDNQLDYAGIDRNGSSDVKFNSYDDSEIKNRLNSSEKKIDQILKSLGADKGSSSASSSSTASTKDGGGTFVSKDGKKYDIVTDAKGNKFAIVDGVKKQILKDGDGREYFLDEKGKPVYLDEGKMTSSSTASTKDGSGTFVSKDGKKYDIVTDAKGNKFVVGADGIKRQILKDDKGREYFLDEKGKKVFLDEGVSSRVKKNSDGTESLEVFQAGEWRKFNDLNKKEQRKVLDSINKDTKNKGGNLVDGNAGYVNEDGDFVFYTKDDLEKYAKTAGSGGVANDLGGNVNLPTVQNASSLPVPTKLSAKNIDMQEAVNMMGLLQKNKEQAKSSNPFKTMAIAQAEQLPIFDELKKSNEKAIADQLAAKKDKGIKIKDIAMCDLDVKKEIIATSEHMEIFCTSPKFGSFVLLTDLKNELKDNIPTLRASAKEITFSANGYLNPEEYIIADSLVLNAHTANSNIATRVNMRRFEKYLAKTGSDAYAFAKSGVDKYTDALSASLENTTITTDINTGDRTTQSNSTRPKLMDYLTPVGVQVAMAVIGNGLEVIFKDSPVMYEIDKGTKLKVYLTLQKGGEIDVGDANKTSKVEINEKNNKK